MHVVINDLGKMRNQSNNEHSYIEELTVFKRVMLLKNGGQGKI